MINTYASLNLVIKATISSKMGESHMNMTKDVKMSIRISLIVSMLLLGIMATSLSASATQDEILEIVEWEYVSQEKIAVKQNDGTTKIKVAEIYAPLPSQKPRNNKVVAFNILINTESNGKHFGAPGSVAGRTEPSKSKKGAIGVAQVMPNTAKYIAKRAGIKWSAEKYKNDPAYNRRLGYLYFDYLFKNFNGDFTKVYAAYNAGPTRLRSTIRKHGPHWLSHMPRETRAYVRKNMRQLSQKNS
jgi:hypothetical protein